MSKRPRRNHTPTFNAKIALEALTGNQTLVALSQRYQVRMPCVNLLKKVPLDLLLANFD